MCLEFQALINTLESRDLQDMTFLWQNKYSDVICVYPAIFTLYTLKTTLKH